MIASVSGRLADWTVLPRPLFTEEHELFREAVRAFVEREIVTFHMEWEEAGVVPRELWSKAGRAGLLCCEVPTEYGGPGGTFLDSVIVMEELARVGASGPAFHLHSDIVAAYLLQFGTAEQKQTWLPRMVDGSAIGAIAMSEPGVGSDLQNIQTMAERSDGEYVLTGQKTFISNGQLADIIIVAAQIERGAAAKGIGLFLVEGDRAGFARGRKLNKIGLKAQDTSELFFDHVRLPAANLLGGVERQGFAQLMSNLAQERLTQGVRAVATSEAAIQWTLDYAKERTVFGRPLADYQNTQFKLAELAALVTGQRAFLDRCLQIHLESRIDPVTAAMLKLTTAELLGKVVDECLQLFGGWGYMVESPIARAYVDGRLMRLGGGTTEVMKHIISRALVNPKR